MLPLFIALCHIIHIHYAVEGWTLVEMCFMGLLIYMITLQSSNSFYVHNDVIKRMLVRCKALYYRSFQLVARDTAGFVKSLFLVIIYLS